MVPKAASSSADAVCLDLEDSVTPAHKVPARRQAIEALRSVEFGDRLRVLRINALDTSFAYRDVVDIVEAVAGFIDLIMIPKVASPRDVVFVDMLLSQIEPGRRSGRPIRLEAQIETASGFVNAREIASASSRLDALVFGPGDYAASMGMPSSAIGERDAYDEIYPGDRWHAAMHTVVAVARANGLRCMDGPYAGYTDTTGLGRACQIARAMGFDGKQCIHPSQLPVVHAAFTPSNEEVARAAALVAAYDASVAEGSGAAVHDGRMIDAASLRMARRVLDMKEG
jgi:citrate lyase beta subunit